MDTPETPRNGSYVTWRELALALAPLKDQGNRIEKTVNLLAGHWFEEIGAERERRKRGRSARFWVTTMATLFCGVLAALIALLVAQ